MKEDERGEKQKPWKKEETLRENQSDSKKKKRFYEEGDQKLFGKGYWNMFKSSKRGKN